MEVSEKVVEINFGTGVSHEFVPVGRSAHGTVTSFKFVDNLLKVPWERKHIAMLLL